MPPSPKLRVYLSGPVTGHSSGAIHAWRRAVERKVEGLVDVVDPTAYPIDATVAYEKASSVLLGTACALDEHDRLRHGLHVVNRNRALIENCDLVLANLLGCGDRASIGTVAEIFIADTLGKPVILVREAHGNVHDHAMLNAVASVLCHSLDDAIGAVKEWAGQRPRRARYGSRVG